MAQTIKLKRSALQGTSPTTSSLELGEVAINTYDGKMYIKKDDGTESIVEVGSSTNVTLDGTPNYITISGQVITRNQIALSTDVTGVLPSVNMDADTAHLSGMQTFLGEKTFNEIRVKSYLNWQVSAADEARQRADARDDATNYSRLHWNGLTDAAVQSNFRHAWYDGAGYINVTANSSGRIDFGGTAATMYIGADRVFDDGYHPNADGWTTGRTIELTGDVTGTSAAWDGTGNISFAATVGNDTHTHNANNLTGNTLAAGVTASSLTSVGTIATGTWQGGAIASAYLDTDTAHLSGTQTFSGVKTFASGASPITVHRASTANSNIKFSNTVRTTYFGLDPDVSGEVLVGTSADLQGTGKKLIHDADKISALAATTSSELASVMSDETGSGSLVFATSPTLVTPVLGTPTSGDLANCTFPTLNQNTTGSSDTIEITATGTSGNYRMIFTGASDVTENSASIFKDSAANLYYNPSTNILNAPNLVLSGDLTVNGTTTIIDTTNLLVEDKNIEIGNVTTPSDTTADGGGITLLGTTNKTIAWSNANDAWEFNQDLRVTHAVSPKLRLEDTTNNSVFQAYAQDANSFVGTGSAHNLLIGTNNIAAITINNSQDTSINNDLSVVGNAGIGSSNPQGVLDLGSATGGRGIAWGGSSGTNHYSSIWSEYGNASIIVGAGLKGSTSAASFLNPFTGTYGYAAIELDSFSSDGMKFYTGADAARTKDAAIVPVERMRITTAGNVGIGKTAPATALDVDGVITATGGSSTNWNAAEANRAISDSVSTTSSTTSASSTAAKAAYDRSWPNTEYTDGAGITQSGTVFSISSHAGTAGLIGTVNSSGNTLGVTLGSTSITSHRGDHGSTAYTHSQAAHAPSGAEANVDTNLTWTAGTTAGPTVNSSTGLDAVIPSASASASGAVTTGTQTFAGAKTFTGEIITSTLGTSNLVLGAGAGAAIASGGNYNVLVGEGAGAAIGTGVNNTALGYEALYSNTTTSPGQIAVGYQSLRSNTTGTLNQAMGYRALYANTNGQQNLAVGYEALSTQTAGYSNHAFGYRSLYANTSGGYNSAFGHTALENNSTASYSVAVGYGTLNDSNGADNTAVGTVALTLNTTGTSNTGLGRSALFSNTIGSNNTATGRSALVGNTEGTNNTASGYQALNSNTTSSDNTASGYQALHLSTGSKNIGIGSGAGDAITTGSNNTVIGDLPGTTALSSTVLIGAGTTERIKVDSTGLYVNGTLLGGGLSTDGTPKTGNFSAVTSTRYLVDTSSSAITATLPSSPSVGDLVSFVDLEGSFSTNNLTLDPNGSNILRSASAAVVNINNWNTSWLYTDATSGWLPTGAAPVDTPASSGGGSGFQVEATVQTALFTASVGKLYKLDCTGGSFNVTLPASPSEGDEVHFRFVNGSAPSSSNVTFLRNGSEIEDASEDLVWDVDSPKYFGLLYLTQDGWVII